ncbi:putative ferric-chelate reductase 1 isoform X3 [Octopus vulgaris]|uniref:Ferric-chelate reductase 1 isoform X3 n=1 Tax=Octopus vulgaris TaxID=6645 RepID=A0AA36BVD2_OCTVU|nr:putative ferric-chelate reductase 1 isoform X3 [Octopus vulgaris]
MPSDSYSFMVPSSKVGRIIGKKGSKIRELQQDTRTRIIVNNSNSDQTNVEIRGDQRDVVRAKALIQQVIDGDEPAEYQNRSYQNRLRNKENLENSHQKCYNCGKNGHISRNCDQDPELWGDPKAQEFQCSVYGTEDWNQSQRRESQRISQNGNGERSSFVESYSVFWANLKTPLLPTPTGMPVTPTSVPGKSRNSWKCSEKFECQVSWEMDEASKTINFEFNLKVTNDRSYIALGLSEDDDMGSDSVMECLYYNGQVKGQYSYNEGTHNSKVTDLTLNNGKYVNGLMTCNFTRDNVMNNSKIFNIGQKQWYLLAAAGPVKDGFMKRKHTFTATTSGKVDFSKQNPVDSEEEEILTHLHGVSMIVAWVFFASVGIFAARYSKSVNKKLCKIMLWFQLHRTFMVLAMLLTILGFILIFIQNEGEYSELQGSSAKAHPIIGIIVTIFVIINPILGYFRPGKDHPKRIYFNWVHSMIGTILMILADVAIFIGVLMHSKMENVERMYDAFVIEMSLFLVYKFVAGCGMEIMEYCNQDKVSAYEMNTPGQNKPPEPEVNKEEKVKTIMLLVHTVICLAFTISLIATLFMKP